MARRRYGEVTSGSGKSHQGRRITMAQPVSSILGDVVKSCRSIAHSDDFEGHKFNTHKFSAANPIGFEYIILILMSCVAWPNQTPIGTASNFLQCKWVSCSKSYWQGYDLGWYKDMGAPCFPQLNLWLARCASMSWTALKKSYIHPGITNWEKTFIPLRAESVAGFVGAPSAPSVVSVQSFAVLPSAPSCEMVRDGADGEHSDTTALCDRNVSFQPARNIPSLCWCLPPVPPVSAKQGDRDCYFLFRQNVCTSGSSSRRKQQQQQEAAAGGSNSSRRQQQQEEEAAAAGGSSSSRRKQQQQAEAAAAGGSSSSRRKQQQQAEAAAGAGSSSSSSSRQQQQQQAAGSRQQAAGSRQQAAGSSQQPAGSSSQQAAAAAAAASSQQAAGGRRQQQQQAEAAAAAGGSSSSSSRRKQQQQAAGSRFSLTNDLQIWRSFIAGTLYLLVLFGGSDVLSVGFSS